MYSWTGAIWTTYKPEAGEEFIVRFAQYLVERSWLKPKRAPDLIQIIQGKGDVRLQSLIQALREGRKVGPARIRARAKIT
jgi:hypothetical protein